MNNMPTVTKNLLIINALVFVVTLLPLSTLDVTRDFGLYYFQSPDFHFYQLLTYMFVHSSQSFSHIFFNMFALWMFGRVMENVWGPRKFLFYYLLCGLGAGLTQEVAQFLHVIIEGDALTYIDTTQGTLAITVRQLAYVTPTIGASGAVYGILLAFGMSFPNERMFIFPIPVPIKAKWFVIGYAAIELFSVWASANDGVAHVAHLGGMLFGFLAILYWRRHPGSDARFSQNRGHEFFDNLKRSFEKRKGPKTTANTGRQSSREADMEYNARKQQRQAEVDAILDKIRKSGYDSLTKEEKKRLFDASNER
ncbi:MAG: rhomboid family intramembrane serine protease [Prevotella sp.]|nr:rhomboid family intramembrane serine protease [Prevotella sp.]